jgi:hypothetical protein
MTLKVLAVVEPVLTAMGAEPDPPCWVAWGDDPTIRYGILVPIPAGLIVCVVRVNVPGEGARTTAKLVRWNRVQLGELAIETQAGHRIVTFQVDQYVLRGVDDHADTVGGFALALYAAVDGRPLPDLGGGARRRAGRGKAATKGAAKKPRKPAARRTASGAAAPAAGPGRSLARLGSPGDIASRGRPGQV